MISIRSGSRSNGMVVQIRPGADEVGVTETEMSGRKVLKDEGDIQMWQESLEDRRPGHLFRYFVGSPEGTRNLSTLPTKPGSASKASSARASTCRFG